MKTTATTTKVHIGHKGDISGRLRLHRRHFYAVIQWLFSHPKGMCSYCNNEFLAFDFHYMQIWHFSAHIHNKSHLYMFHGALCSLACWVLFSLYHRSFSQIYFKGHLSYQKKHKNKYWCYFECIFALLRLLSKKYE